MIRGITTTNENKGVSPYFHKRIAGHDQKTARNQMATGANDNRRMIEEPDESKDSRPVL
jgi:hypothetical protein